MTVPGLGIEDLDALPGLLPGLLPTRSLISEKGEGPAALTEPGCGLPCVHRELTATPFTLCGHCLLSSRR